MWAHLSWQMEFKTCTVGDNTAGVCRAQSPVARNAKICNAVVTCMPSHTVGPRTRSLEARTAPVWRALADPTRRRGLGLLLDGPRIRRGIASHFPISPRAVMRHL